MATIQFTRNLQRHIVVPPAEISAGTLAEALKQVFAINPAARSYILNDQGGLREHIAVFINNELIADRVNLSDSVPENAEIYVLQALSGG